MATLVSGLELHLERGPDWVFVKIRGTEGCDWQGTGFAETVWNLMQQEFVNRIVLDLEDVPLMRSSLVAEFVLLHKRVTTNGGLLRLCHLTESNEQVLRISRLHQRFPAYESREAAVMGYRPAQPR